MLEKEVKRIIRKMPTLETDRLILRRLNKRDSADVFEYSSDPRVPEFLTWSPHESEEYTREYLAFLTRRYRTGEYLDWAVVLKDSGKVIGTCGFTAVDIQNSKVEIGYVLNRAYWSRGYAFEAVERVISHALDTLGFNRIEARVLEGNTPSVKLLERLSFSLEGRGIKELFIKGEYKNVWHFARLKG